MKNVLTRTIAVFLAIVLVFGAIPGSALRTTGQSFSDVSVGHWAHPVINRWGGHGYGVLLGMGDGTFAPDEGLTLAHLTGMLSRTFGYIERMPTTVTPPWATGYIEKAIAAGVIPHADFINADIVITREQAVRYIARAYGVEPIAGNTTFVDNAYIGLDYRAYVTAFQRAGFVRGRCYNTFAPQEAFTRAEVMQVLDNMVSEITDTSLNGQVFARSLIVRSADVTISNTIVGGNLYLAHGIGDGTVTLYNVTVNGVVIIFGGGDVYLVGDFGTVIVKNNANVTVTGTVENMVRKYTLQEETTAAIARTRPSTQSTDDYEYVPSGYTPPTPPNIPTPPTSPSLPTPPAPPSPIPGLGTTGSITNVRAVLGTSNIAVEISVDGFAYLDVSIHCEYDETLFSSGRVRIDEAIEVEFVDLTLSDILPRHFLVYAILTDGIGNKLSDPILFIDYTLMYEEFLALTIYDFPQDLVINLDDAIDNNFMVATDGVIRINMDWREDTLTVLDEYTFILHNAQYDIFSLNVGDRVIITSNNDANIYLIEIVTIIQSGYDITIISLNEPTITDFFDHIRVEMRQYISDPYEPMGVMPFMMAHDLDIRRTFRRDFNEVFGGSYTNIEVDAFIELSVWITASVSYSVRWRRTGLLNIPYPAGINLQARFAVGYSAEIDVEAKATSRLPSSRPSTSVQIASVSIPVGMGFRTTLTLDLIISWNAQAEGHVNIFSRAEAGITFRNGSVQPFTSRVGPRLEPQFEGSLHFEIGPRLTVSIGWLGLVNASIWVHPRVSINAHAHFNANRPMVGDYHHDCDGCIGGHIDFIIDAGFHVTYSILVFNGTLINRTFRGLIDVRLFSFFYSFANHPDSVHRGRPTFGRHTCPNKLYRITFVPQDAQGHAINDAIASVNRLGERGTPIAEGTGQFSVFLRSGSYTAMVRYRNVDFPRHFIVGDRAATITIPAVFTPVTGVSVDRAEMPLRVGERGLLAATVAPANASDTIVVWSSSNENVATVDSIGIVTAISAGTATITATTNDGGLTASSTITVFIPVERVNLPRSMTIAVGTTELLIPTITPVYATNQTVAWSSSAPNVATVNSWGSVTAIAPGEAIIHATTADGGRMAGTVITVRREQPPLSIIHPGELTFGDGDFALATTGGSGTGETRFWIISGPDTIEISDNIAEIVGAGIVELYAVRTGDSNYFHTVSDSITITIGRRSLDYVDIRLGMAAYTPFTGNAINPAVYVEDIHALITWRDFEYTISDNLNVGTATVTVAATARGNYYGQRILYFDITPLRLRFYADNINLPYINYGDDSPLTWRVLGLVENDRYDPDYRINVFHGAQPTLTTTYRPGGPVNPDGFVIYIEPGNLVDLVEWNYYFVEDEDFIPGLLTIGGEPQPELVLTSSIASKIYGDADFEIEVTGGRAGGAVSFEVTGAGEIVSRSGCGYRVTVRSTRAGNIQIVARKSGGGGYQSAISNIATIPVGQRALSILSATHTRPYDGTLDAPGTTDTAGIVVELDRGGIINNDYVSVGTVIAYYTSPNAGTTTIRVYYVYLTGLDGGSYIVNGLPMEFTVEGITPRTISFPNPGVRDVVFSSGLTLAGVSLPDGFMWNTPETSLNVANSGESFYATFNCPSGNFVPVEGRVVVNVEPVDGTFPEIDPISVVFTPTLTLWNVELPSGYAWVNGGTGLTVADSGRRFPARFTDPSDNFLPGCGYIIVNVSRAEGAAVSRPEALNVTINSITINPVALTPGDTGQVVEYAISTVGNATPTIWQDSTIFRYLISGTTLTSGTTYYIYARSAQGDNHFAGAPSVTPIATLPSGDGTQGNPFRIWNVNDLLEVGRGNEHNGGVWAANSHYRLMVDIDLTGRGSWSPIPLFAGIFDGNGHTIAGLTINSTSNEQGMFAHIDGGTVLNLALTNVNVRGYQYVGGLVGRIVRGRIENVFVSGVVSGTSDSIGGIVGRINAPGGTAYAVSIYGSLSLTTVSGRNGVGGIVGTSTQRASLRAVTAMGMSVSGGESTGRVIGTSPTASNSVNVYHVFGCQDMLVNGTRMPPPLPGFPFIGDAHQSRHGAPVALVYRTIMTGNNSWHWRLGHGRWIVDEVQWSMMQYWISVHMMPNLPSPVVAPLAIEFFNVMVETYGNGQAFILPYGETFAFFSANEVITVSATPAEGYIFIEWQDKSGNHVSYNAVHTFYITESLTLVAVFAAYAYDAGELPFPDITPPYAKPEEDNDGDSPDENDITPDPEGDENNDDTYDAPHQGSTPDELPNYTPPYTPGDNTHTPDTNVISNKNDDEYETEDENSPQP